MPKGPIKGKAPADPEAHRAFVEELRRRYQEGSLELDWDPEDEVPDRLLRDLARDPLLPDPADGSEP